jgi:hypothetical protein
MQRLLLPPNNDDRGIIVADAGLSGGVAAQHDPLETVALRRDIVASQAALIMLPSGGVGFCWYWAAKTRLPISRFSSSIASALSRAGCSNCPVGR